ncbi:MAG TPA: energy-coupling factor transporter ATPase [Desulfotomaculum sp.]|nr:energy-coupling factor transporter ATPase [Desulfotomaculum sp.]
MTGGTDDRAPEPVLRVENLCFSYRAGEPVLQNVSLEIHRGEIVALIGQNGAGKSTLARHFNGLLKPERGRVLVDGRDTAGEPVAALARTVGYVFQNPDRQIFHDTVAREVAFGVQNMGYSREEVDRRVQRALAAVGLEGCAGAYPFALSRGQRQRLALASVLAMEPPVIILDEPTTGQDYRESMEIMELVDNLNRRGHTILFITHDMSLVARFARRVVVLCRGRVLMDGPVRQVFSQPDVLGQTFLRPPQITRLAQSLEAYGIPGDVLTVEELYRHLLELRGSREKRAASM